MSITSDFLASIKQGALNTWKTHKILPSVVAAQAALESDWGRSGLAAHPNNNLFGIKWTGTGTYVTMPTWEVINGQNVTVNAKFRTYPNRGDSIVDHGRFFHDNSRYHGLIGMTNYAAQAKAIQAAGYATDPNYASKLISTIEYNGLQSWDSEALGGTSGGGGNATVPPTTGTVHIVVTNENLDGIASKYGTTANAIANLNQLPDKNLIYAGQHLKIPNGTSPEVTKVYYVVSGDTLEGIASKFGVMLSDLLKWNPSITDKDLIFAGQQIALRPKQEVGKRSYKIKSGDTLSQIAINLGVNMQSLAKDNNISDPSKINAGKVLYY